MSLDWRNPDYGPVFLARATRLKMLSEANAAEIAAVKAHYRENPVDFINDWACTFDPRNAELNRPTDIPMILFPKQEECVRWVAERWRARQNGLLEKSRDMGASWIMVWIAIWMWLNFPGTVVGFGSRKEEYVDSAGDMKALFPKIRFGIDRLPRMLRPKGWDTKRYAPFMRITNPENQSSIVGEAGDNIGRGARTSIYFVDESAFIERPQLVDAALSQTTNCRIDLSTPNGESNPFAQKRFAGKLPVFTLHWRDHPAKDDDWYRDQCAKLDDPVVIAQELNIDYAASSTDQFISGDLVEAAMALDASKIESLGPLILAVDVARFGDNETVMSLRRGRVVHWVKAFRGLDTMMTVDMVKTEVDAMPGRPAQIAIDVIGVGAGVFDRLRQLYPGIVVAVNSSERTEDGKNYNMRAKMWAEFKAWLKDGPVVLPRDHTLKTQLTSPKYKFRDNRLLIESKDEMKKRGIQSPDRADAIVLGFAIPARERRERVPRERNWRTA
ncbi:MAG: hypothetical protein ACK5XA_15805 [Tagaea sp.]